MNEEPTLVRLATRTAATARPMHGQPATPELDEAFALVGDSELRRHEAHDASQAEPPSRDDLATLLREQMGTLAAQQQRLADLLAGLEAPNAAGRLAERS